MSKRSYDIWMAGFLGWNLHAALIHATQSKWIFVLVDVLFAVLLSYCLWRGRETATREAALDREVYEQQRAQVSKT